MIPQETVSLLLGYTSIGFWLGAQFPQIVVNYKRKSVDGLALPFLVNWFLGDSTNLIGCILTNQLPFQTYLASYFVFVDSCLVVQYFHYDSHRININADNIIYSASSIITAPPPHARARSRTPSRTRASSLAENSKAVISNLVQGRRRAKSMGPMGMNVNIDLRRATEVMAGVGSSSRGRGVAQSRIVTRSRSQFALDRGGATLNRIDKGRSNIDDVKDNNSEDDDDDDDDDSHMITSFYSEDGKPTSEVKHISWERSPIENETRNIVSSGSRDRSDQANAKDRQRSRSISGRFISYPPSITEEAISSSPTNVDNRGRPTTPRSARVDDDNGGTDDYTHGCGYPDESAIAYSRTATQPFPSISEPDQRLIWETNPLYQSHSDLQRSRSSSTSTSAVGEGPSRRSIAFFSVLVLLGFSNFNNVGHLSAPTMSLSSTRQGNVLTSSSSISSSDSEPMIHNHQYQRQYQYHYYRHPYHHHAHPYVSTPTSMHTPRSTPVKPLTFDDNSQTQWLIGYISAWICTAFYLTSRLPQIWKNYTRKSVEGLSMYLFTFAFLGNLFYVLSILTSPNMTELPPEESREYFQGSIPYLLGSGGTLLFDVIIVSQSFIYRNDDRYEEIEDGDVRKRPVRTMSSGVMPNPSMSMGVGGSTSRRYGYGWSVGRGKGKKGVRKRDVNDEERGLLDADVAG